MKLPRYYNDLDKYLLKNKVLIIYGPRQDGKTTLLIDYLSKLKYKLDSGDDINIHEIMGT